MTVESRETFYDYEVELPTGLWHIGQRKLKLRTGVLAQGHTNEDGTFVVRRVVRVLYHEVNPPGWKLPPEPEDERHTSRVSV